jgi:hypothetical protein
MKRSGRVVLALAIGTMPLAGWADENRIEVIAGVGAYQTQSGSASSFAIPGTEPSLGIGMTVYQLLELGLRIGFDTYSSTTELPGGTQVFATVGPTVNIAVNEKGLADAFFLAVGAGLNYNHLSSYQPNGTQYYSNPESTLALAYSIEVGKRFALLPNVSWMPSFTVTGYRGSNVFDNSVDELPTYSVIPLRFSVHF